MMHFTRFRPCTQGMSTYTRFNVVLKYSYSGSVVIMFLKEQIAGRRNAVACIEKSTGAVR